MWPLTATRSSRPSRSISRNAQPKPRLSREAWPTPALTAAIRIAAGARRAVERHHFVVEVGDGDAFGAGVVEIGRVDSHSGARLAILAESHAGAHRHVFKRAVAQVAVELVGLRVVGDQHVQPAVAVVIHQRHAQRFRGAIEDAALGGDVFEGAVAAVAEQPAGFAVIRLGRAVGFALAVHAAEHVVLRRPLHVVADEQVEEAVAVEIEPQRRGAEADAPAQAGLAR